ncbi:MAG: GNAT family N-acetyltransferase [Planctomycetaceae bacterium]|nr:GNAT family N-acetyltransferase [Planctomycetaceae bacterium]
MESSSPVIRPMELGDIDVMLSLVELAGWNQTRPDLTRLLEHQPGGCFVAEVLGRPVGTITTTSHGRDVAWIGMMLVHPDFRRRGIATALMQRAIDWLLESGIPCIKLDATPEGATVYEQLGFCAEYGLKRYVRAGHEKGVSISMTTNDFHVPALDARAFGADRSDYLKRLAKDSRVVCVANGYGMIRSGRVAASLGPVIADSSEGAHAIADRLLEGITQTVYWDLPDSNAEAIRVANALGFEPVRTLSRMWLGSRRVMDRPEFVFGLTDFATG